MSRTKKSHKGLILFLLILIVLILAGGAFLYMRYSPSKEKMSLTEYFTGLQGDEAAVIVNGKYLGAPEDKEAAKAFYKDKTLYIRQDVLHDSVDRGFVYDSTEGILRYVTDKDVITVNAASAGTGTYTVNRDNKTFNGAILSSANGTVYINADFAKQYADFSWKVFDKPNRAVITKAGWKRKTATVRSEESARRMAGIKSSILTNLSKGDQVSIIEDYGKWSLVLTPDGVLGCVRDSKLKNVKETTAKATLPKRTYNHRMFDGKVVLGFHQVTNASANKNIQSVLADTSGVNVIAPTWFYLNDNAGGISDLSSADYVTYCHSQGVQVWGLVSNLEDENADTKTVLNTTSARDALVNHLIAAAIACNMDGINVDIESLASDEAAGYIEFIKELSLKCEANDLILSVDNYVPSYGSGIYQRDVQANYADYNVVMAYDEHYNGSKEAGSVSSLSFVRKGIEDTLKEMPKNQVILGLPFYTRVWTTTSAGKVSSEVLQMKDEDQYLSDNQLTKKWSDKAGQNYVEWTDSNGAQKQIWLEDADSIAKKMEIYKKNDLGGAAFWKLDMEPSSIWQTIKDGM